MALGYYPRLAEVIGDYSLHSIPLCVEVKRTILYIFSSHKREQYSVSGEACQPLKNFFTVDICVKYDIISPVVNEKSKKPRAVVRWNTGERVHRPKKGRGSYNRGVVKRQDGSLQKNN